MRKLSEKVKEQVQEEVETQLQMFPADIQLPRNMGLFGDVSEETSADVIKTLLTLNEAGKSEETKRGKTVTTNDPIEFYICTHGGSASDMFAIYDTMRLVKNTSPIHTIGIGKVMSAGVLLLAAGTKGQRKIGKHCRVMIHAVAAGSEGPIHSLENEMSEVKFTQQAYISALKTETKMSEQTIKKMLEKHVNIYLSAEEAVKYGIADEVI